MEALEKIKAGAKFDEIARQYSEDKARQGVKQNIYLQPKKLNKNISNICIFLFFKITTTTKIGRFRLDDKR